MSWPDLIRPPSVRGSTRTMEFYAHLGGPLLRAMTRVGRGRPMTRAGKERAMAIEGEERTATCGRPSADLPRIVEHFRKAQKGPSPKGTHRKYPRSAPCGTAQLMISGRQMGAPYEGNR